MSEETKDTLKSGASKAAGIGTGAGALYVAGTTGYSAVGITTGLATLGLGSMLAGVFVVGAITVGAAVVAGELMK